MYVMEAIRTPDSAASTPEKAQTWAIIRVAFVPESWTASRFWKVARMIRLFAG